MFSLQWLVGRIGKRASDTDIFTIIMQYSICSESLYISSSTWFLHAYKVLVDLTQVALALCYVDFGHFLRKGLFGSGCGVLERHRTS